ncbi:hypothetical protein [[Phormidium] sp. ETS-05]|nr:hypothetical protein [[Phormidium] sp. ETS-05]
MFVSHGYLIKILAHPLTDHPATDNPETPEGFYPAKDGIDADCYS